MPRVMSLRDGMKKMSKSDPSDYSRINMTDDYSTIKDKLKKAKTDSVSTVFLTHTHPLRFHTIPNPDQKYRISSKYMLHFLINP